jgi:hypothetical protein
MSIVKPISTKFTYLHFFSSGLSSSKSIKTGWCVLVVISDGHRFMLPHRIAGAGAGWFFLPLANPVPVSRVCRFESGRVFSSSKSLINKLQQHNNIHNNMTRHMVCSRLPVMGPNDVTRHLGSWRVMLLCMLLCCCSLLIKDIDDEKTLPDSNPQTRLTGTGLARGKKNHPAPVPAVPVPAIPRGSINPCPSLCAGVWKRVISFRNN